jgi:hypothetical protein
MATETQRTRFRGRLGDANGVVWSDAEVDAKFDEALDVYPNASNDLQLAYAIRSALEELMADSAKRTNYSQNASSESAGDVFGNLLKLHRLWDERVADLAGSSLPSVRWGGFEGLRSDKEVPNA